MPTFYPSDAYDAENPRGMFATTPKKGIAAQQGAIRAASPSLAADPTANLFGGLLTSSLARPQSVGTSPNPLGESLYSAFGASAPTPSFSVNWGNAPSAPNAPAAPGNQQPQYYVQPNYQSPTLHDYGMNTVAPALNSWLLGSYLTGPSQMAQQVNDAWAQQSNINANNAFRNRVLDTLSGMFGGGAGGNRLTGFQDVNSGQAAALPGTSLPAAPGGGGTTSSNVGQYRTNITAQAPSTEMIDSATSALRSSQPAGGGDLANLRRDLRANSDNASATALDRSLMQARALMRQNIQNATAQQGLGMAGYLAGLDGDNARLQMATQLPMLRALLGMVT